MSRQPPSISTEIASEFLSSAKSLLHLKPSQYLDRIASIACNNQKVEYRALSTVQKLFVSHFRCQSCGLTPLYNLDLTHFTRPRCMNCDSVVPFRSSGKYGRIRKEIALAIRRDLSGRRQES